MPVDLSANYTMEKVETLTSDDRVVINGQSVEMRVEQKPRSAWIWWDDPVTGERMHIRPRLGTGLLVWTERDQVRAINNDS